MADENLITGSEENKPQTLPAEAITTVSMDSGASNEERQHGVGEDQAHEEGKPEAEPLRSPRESRATAESPAKKTPIEAPCDVAIALMNIKALGDCLICIHDAQINGTVEPFDETIQTIGYMLIAQARCAAAELDLGIED